ncbi:MAG TPA: hypothetical protein PLO89_08515 [Spirochaetota bacterium]|nr:hypothetical protein [Spirochaetota bacterium]
MIFFLLKKTFQDVADNFVAILLFNLLIVAFSAILYFIFRITPAFLFFIPLFFLFFIITALFLAFIVFLNGLKNFNLIKILFSSAYLSTINIFIFFFGGYSISFYFKSDNVIFYTLGFFLFWIIIIWITGLLFYIPYLHRNNYDGNKNIGKVFYIIFNNLFFSLFVLIIFTIFCVSTIFPILGFGAGVIFIDDSLKTILKKYDHIVKNGSKKIDWKEI